MKRLIEMLLAAVLLLAVLLPAGCAAEGKAAPEWADVTLNEKGFLDEGRYVLEDPDAGRWMYVDQTLRIQIERTFEKPEKLQKKDKDQQFNCFTAEIWCDIEAGERLIPVWSNAEKPQKDPKIISKIATENNLVYAVSADYFQYRAGLAKSNKNRHVGIEIRESEILFDDPNRAKDPGRMPSYETLAIYADGHAESYPSKEKGAEEYIAEGALQVYTFGPVLVKDGEIPENIFNNQSRELNPRHAFGVVEPGHYIDVICEGRLKSVNGSTGVMMENLAMVMKERGCQLAINFDGGQTAVCVFMGKQLNKIGDKKLQKGRQQVEAIGFGLRPGLTE